MNIVAPSSRLQSWPGPAVRLSGRQAGRLSRLSGCQAVRSESSRAIVLSQLCGSAYALEVLYK
jgi:hypothetical protein